MIPGQSLLHIACLCGDEKIVRWILSRCGTHVTLWTTVENSNALHCAAYCGSVPILRILLESWSPKKRRLVLSLKDSRGNTPLHLATINEHSEAVLFLINCGADVEAVNACGLNAQTIASIRGNGTLAALIAGYNSRNRTLPLRPSRSIDSQLLATSISSRCQSVPSVLDDETWTGMGLSAVEQIDKVLDEIEVLGRCR
ncbi:hypothetical protein GCK32_017194 [Trichostrongylus colubriformis]|uniref:Uncharacterized protein n=1 Tax=Trichostrongylus colubriformis TaxID=6319 RepID=A0AAN8FW39_TRICO